MNNEINEKGFMDYMDYMSNQPMRDGEEICDFLNEVNEKEEEA